jgi:hypothetical protein
MKTNNEKTDVMVDRIGWGLFFIMIGGLFLAQNQGWMNAGWWSYFAIGLGCIFIIGFLARYFTGSSWGKSLSGLVIGLALVFIGIAFLFGFGNLWPLALLFIGVVYLIKAITGKNSEISSQQ